MTIRRKALIALAGFLFVAANLYTLRLDRNALKHAGYRDSVGDMMAGDPSAFPYAFPVPNDSATGTTQFTLTKINSSGNAVIMATTDTSGYAGICVANCGKTGTAWIAGYGLIPITMDATSTAQHYVTISSTTTGNGHDSGATSYPGSGAVVGRVQVGVTGAGAAMVLVFPPEIVSASLISGTPVTGQIATWANATQVKGLDLPTPFFIPAANCNNATAGDAWSIGSGGTVTCRAGTNNIGGYIPITDTASTFAQFTTVIPFDWDPSATNCGGGVCNPSIRFYVASADTTSGHTIIPQIKVSCGKGDGSTTDDVTFNAAHSSSTVTLNTTANQFWSSSNVQLNSTDMTGCVAGSMMTVQVGRATDTATSAFFYGATLTFPRLPVVQAD
jgi:hypothetical protein